MHTALKVPSVGSLSASSSRGAESGWGAAGVPSEQGGVEACSVWVLSQVGGVRGWGKGRAQLAPPQQLRGWSAGIPPVRLPCWAGSWGWRTNFHSWEKKMREAEPGRVLWPEPSATDRAEGRTGRRVVGVTQPRLRVSPCAKGPWRGALVGKESPAAAAAAAGGWDTGRG